MLLAIVFIIICMMITLSVKHSQSVHVFLCVCACVFVCRIVFDTLSVQQRNERLFEWINVASIVGCVGRPCSSSRPDRHTENILKENISKVIAVVLSVVMSSSVPDVQKRLPGILFSDVLLSIVLVICMHLVRGLLKEYQ